MASNYLMPELVDSGLGMIISSLNGDSITFTKIVVGNGVPSSSDDISSFTDLVNPLVEISLTTYEENLNRGFVIIGGRVSSEDVDSGFYGYELGVFAKDSSNNEYLFAYRYNDTNVDYFPATSEGRLVEINLQVVVSVGNAENVSAIVTASDAYASKEAFDNHVGDYMNPHRVTKAQVGLGSVPNVSTDDQTPTISEAEDLAVFNEGDTMGVIISKIQKAIHSLIQHIGARNPHNTTPQDIGAATASHTHSTADITSGIMSIARGGTGGGTVANALASLHLADFGVTSSDITDNGRKGYLKFDSGYMLQWGNQTYVTPANTSSYKAFSLTFPEAFTTEPWVTAHMTTQNPQHRWCSLSDVSVSGMKIRIHNGSSSSTTNTVFWVAYGMWQ